MKPRAVFHPAVDVLFTGGLSFAFFLPLFFIDGPIDAASVYLPLLILNTLINSPHIISSAVLLYQNPQSVRLHPFATVVVPVLLLVLCVGCAALGGFGVFPGAPHLLVLAMVVYTPVHFVNQAFGMVAVYSNLDGAPLQPRERTLVRTGLTSLIVFVMSLTALRFKPYPAHLDQLLAPLHQLVTVVALPLVLGGVVGLALYARRLGRLPSAGVLVPWLSIHVWYAALVVHSEAAALIQVFHALQYILFPMRVQMNRDLIAPESREKLVRRTAIVYVVGLVVFAFPQLSAGFDVDVHPAPIIAAVGGGAALALLWVCRDRPSAPAWALLSTATVLGCVAYWFLHRAGSIALGAQGLDAPAFQLSLLVAVFFNIHHYVVDGVLWKLRNKEVRTHLFAHLRATDK